MSTDETINNKPLEGEVIPPDKGGRPTSYKESHIEDMQALMANGYTDARLCAEWGISRNTFYRWLREKEDFKKAHSKGLEVCEAFYEEVGQAAMFGKIPKFNTKIWEKIMKNKFNWDGGAGTSEGGTQINIHGNMNVIQNLSDEELLKKIELSAKLVGLPDILEKDSDDTREDGEPDGA